MGAGIRAGKGPEKANCLGTLPSAPPGSRCWWSLQPYADPVHESTWHWWKNKKQDQVHGEGQKSGEWGIICITGMEFQFYKMKRVVEMECSDGCTECIKYH